MICHLFEEIVDDFPSRYFGYGLGNANIIYLGILHAMIINQLIRILNRTEMKFRLFIFVAKAFYITMQLENSTVKLRC